MKKDGAERGSLTTLPLTAKQLATGSPDPNASLSKNFGYGLNADDSACSGVEQLRLAVVLNQSGRTLDIYRALTRPLTLRKVEYSTP